MVKRCSYYKMCVSSIYPTTWLRLATSFQLRGSGGVKIGFEGAQVFPTCKWNNSDNNFGQYQWKLRSLSLSTSTVHAIHAAETSSLLSSIVRYQIRKYSVVRKGQVQEPIQKIIKSKKTRRQLEVAYSNEEHIQKITKSKKTRRQLEVTDSNEPFYRMEFDGASKGNPGNAGAGAVLRNQDGSLICELKEGVGLATNNVAEYRAVILGLKEALSRGIQKIHVQGDSNLVCMQIQDLWKIKSQNIAELCEEAKELKKKFKEFRINHIYREFNGEADALANAAAELKNGEIKNEIANYQLDNPLEMTSGSQRKKSKKLSKASLALEKPLEKLRKSRKTINKDDVLDNKEPIQKITKSKKSRRKHDVTDSNEVFYWMEFDGASKGNPGRAGAGVVLRNQDGSVICQLKEGVGLATNNVAEYRAVILGLKVALSRGIQKIHVQGDSNLVCMQIQDLWKIKSQNIAELCEKAKELKSKFKEFRINHIDRELNGEADALANAAVELKNGEIEYDMASYQLDNPLEMPSGSQRKNSKKLLKTSLPSEKALEKLLKSRTVNRDDLEDSNKDLLDTAPAIECPTKASKPRRMKSKACVMEPNKDMIQVSSLLEEPVGKRIKSKETRRKLKVTDSNEKPLEKPSTSRRRSKLLTDLDEKPLEKTSTSRRRSKLLTDLDEGFHRLEFDGASKGNPGKAGAGAVLRDQYGSVICELQENVGIATNNMAEYHAIILGLKAALSKGIQRIHVYGDSKLVYMQVQDLWAVKSENIVVLHMEAKKLIRKFKEFHLSHVNRELNCEANNLANAAIELQSAE